MAARSYIRAMGLNGVYNEVDEYMAGQVVFIAGNAIPTGYLECNGATVSRATYATLFSAIGSIYGPGDGATTFNLPDLRGEFLRGADKGRGVDSGRVIGSAQTESIKSHGHGNAIKTPGVEAQGLADGVLWNQYGIGNQVIDHFGGAETRPRNVAMTACIKY